MALHKCWHAFENGAIVSQIIIIIIVDDEDDDGDDDGDDDEEGVELERKEDFSSGR